MEMGAAKRTAYASAVKFGERLRELREAAGLSLSQVGERSGIDRSAWANYEAGRRDNPTLAQLRSMADALGVSLSELLQEVNGD